MVCERFGWTGRSFCPFLHRFLAGLQTADRHDSVKIGSFFAFIGDIVLECGPLMVSQWFKSDGAGAGAGGEGPVDRH